MLITKIEQEPSVTLEVTRNSKGYNWRVLVQGNLEDRKQVMAILQNLEAELAAEFATE